jgi:dienelactone hydrolase
MRGMSTRQFFRSVACGMAILLIAGALRASEPTEVRGEEVQGEIAYQPAADETGIPARFRLAAHTFPYAARSLGIDSPTLQVWDVTFPSPVKSPHERNNTVYCEFYQPLGRAKGQAQTPAVVVLHILGGDFALSRLFCNALAQHGVAALFVKMPYYGPRRDPASRQRMIMPDPNETVAGMTQAILDIRRATAWLAARPDVDRQRLGIFGISLGGITAALAATAEPRLQNVCLLLAGGDVGKIAAQAWELPAAREVRRAWTDKGGTRDEFAAVLRTVDPVAYAANARGKRILMLNAAADEIIPRVCTDSLWEAFGKPPIVWYGGGHYSVARHLFSALDAVTDFFAPPR